MIISSSASTARVAAIHGVMYGTGNDFAAARLYSGDAFIKLSFVKVLRCIRLVDEFAGPGAFCALAFPNKFEV